MTGKIVSIVEKLVGMQHTVCLNYEDLQNIFILNEPKIKIPKSQTISECGLNRLRCKISTSLI